MDVVEKLVSVLVDDVTVSKKSISFNTDVVRFTSDGPNNDAEKVVEKKTGVQFAIPVMEVKLEVLVTGSAAVVETKVNNWFAVVGIIEGEIESTELLIV